jgi:hypothetical protein
MPDHDSTTQREFFDKLHDKIDAYTMEVDRFHDDASHFSRRVAECDRLVRLAQTSLTQIDVKVAEAVQIESRAATIAGAAGREAGRVAAEAAGQAVDQLMQTVADLTADADRVRLALHRSVGKTGLWVAFYVVCTLGLCALTACATYWIAQKNAVTPDIAHYAELGKMHENLLNKANEREVKTINAILARPAKQK